MIKAFTLFNLVGILLFNFFFASEVSIVQDLPERMDPGTEVRVTVTVNKADVTGFAKLQIDLPPGLSATAIETRGASFTFADGKAKFIWMALPTQPSFKVSYSLAAEANAIGSFPVTARLSYIEDNERKTVDMAPATVTIGSGGVMANIRQQEPDEPEVKVMEEAPAPEENIAEQITAVPDHGTDLVSAAPAAVAPDIEMPVLETPLITTTDQGQGAVSASRKVTQVSASELLVEVTIKKGTLRGFGKLQENLPAGLTVVEKSNDDAIFSMTGRMIKYVWLNLPAKSELKVAYRILVPSDASDTYTLSGEFGYLLDDLTQRVVVGNSTFTVDREFVAADTRHTEQETTAQTTTTGPTKTTVTQETKTTVEPGPATTATTTTTTTTTTPTTTSPTTETTATKTQPVRHETTTAQATTKQVTSMPAPETGITFKVQITAAHREVGKPYFVERHNYSGDFSIERHDGWIKYVAGSYDRYRAARDQREAFIQAQYNFPGPFVTAYNNGERITVQEALMISKQGWVQ